VQDLRLGLLDAAQIRVVGVDVGEERLQAKEGVAKVEVKPISVPPAEANAKN